MMVSQQWNDAYFTSFGFGLRFVIVLGLAAAGQYFLVQSGEGIALGLGIGLYALAIYFLLKWVSPENRIGLLSTETLSFNAEAILFLIILALGIFLRAYGANHFPEGVYVDRAEVACGALRILDDHWRPFMDALDLHVPEIWVYYIVAAWFKFFGRSSEVFAYFDVFLSVTGIVLMYFAFRQWMGPLKALLTFFVLAVMRWNFVFAHQNYFQSQTILLMGLTLVPLFYALRKHRPLFAAIAGLVMGAGLYSYQSFKAVPLCIAALFFFEIIGERRLFKKNKEVWAVLWIVFILSAAPYIAWVLHNGELGRRESEVSVFALIHNQNSLTPLWVNIRDAVLVFNHSGADWNNQANFLHHRILDDITGICFVLGFFYALQRIRQKIYFVVLAGLILMCLPAIFSNCGASLGRLLGVTPFVAGLCGLFLSDMWSRWKATQPSVFSKQSVLILSLMLLLGMGFENYYTYFVVQTQIPDCINDCSWPESQTGKFIAGLPSNTECFLPSFYYGNPTVKYLTYPNWDRIHLLDLSRPPQPGLFTKSSDFCFLLDGFKSGELGFLENLYPGGRVQVFRDPFGQIQLYTYLVPSFALKKLKKNITLERGLEGVYRHTQDEREEPFLKRWDPLLNFSFRDLPMTGTPLSIRWVGQFKANKRGVYRFGGMLFPSARGRIVVDQQENPGFTASPYWEGKLNPGWHRLEFDYQDPGTQVTQVNLLWEPPGENQFEIMPNEVFGKIRQ